MADANPQITYFSKDSDLRKRKEEEQVKEEDETEDQEEKEEDQIEEEKPDEIREEAEEVDTCVYDEYKLVEFSDDMLSKVDTEEYRIYLEYATKTEGFYVPFSPEDSFGLLCPAGPSSWWWPMIEEGAEFAVEHYNKNRAGPVDGQLKFVNIRIVNLQTVAGVFFYITLAAENVASGGTIDYQTKLFRGINLKWEVLMFRKDPEIVVEMVERDMARLEPFFRNHDVY